MKRIIDIPEEVVEAFKNGDINNGYYDYNSLIGKAIRNSTPLNEVEAKDCISRVDVCELIGDLYWLDQDYKLVTHKQLDEFFDKVRNLPTVYPKSDKLKRIEQIISDDWEKGFQHSETVARIREVLNDTD